MSAKVTVVSWSKRNLEEKEKQKGRRLRLKSDIEIAASEPATFQGSKIKSVKSGWSLVQGLRSP